MSANERFRERRDAAWWAFVAAARGDATIVAAGLELALAHAQVATVGEHFDSRYPFPPKSPEWSDVDNERRAPVIEKLRTHAAVLRAGGKVAEACDVDAAADALEVRW